MRNRYVLQVLLATFGFAMVLAVIAVLQTPADRPPAETGIPRKSSESPQCRLNEPTAPCPKTAPRIDDSKGDCDFPARLINN